MMTLIVTTAAIAVVLLLGAGAVVLFLAFVAMAIDLIRTGGGYK